VILIQATVNFFAVLGVLPLTGVPLPFISYGNSNLVVLLAGMGILINVAQRPAGRAKLRVVGGDRGRANAPIARKKADADDRDRSRRNRRARGAGAGGRRRAAG
jgi:cell division protein FtsW